MRKEHIKRILLGIILSVVVIWILFCAGFRLYWSGNYDTYKRVEEEPMRSVEIRLNGRDTAYRYLVDRTNYEYLGKEHKKVYVYSIQSIYTDDIEVYSDR